MTARLSSTLAVLLLLSWSHVTVVHAEDAIAPEKKRVIKELLDTLNAGKMAEQISDTFLKQIEQNYTQLMADEHTGETPDHEQDHQAILESQARIAKRFRELYPQRVNFAQAVETIYYPLYDKYYTQNELNDLLAFYKSPTGKKALAVMPQLLREAMQRSSELLLPQIRQLANEVVQEEKARLRSLKAEHQKAETGAHAEPSHESSPPTTKP